MQKSVFSLKKSVVALAVLSVSSVGAAQNSSNNNPELSQKIVENSKIETELSALNDIADLAYNAVYINNVYKRLQASVARNGNSVLGAWSIATDALTKQLGLMENIRRGNVDISSLKNDIIKIKSEKQNSLKALEQIGNQSPTDSSLITALANQVVINQKLRELVVGSREQLKLDIDRLDDVVKGHREEINWLKSDLEDAVIGIEGNSNQIAAVSYDLADLQSEVEYTTSTMREDIAEAHEAIVLLDRADEIQFERLNEIAKVNEEINYRQDSQLREKADKSALMGLERLVVKNISGIEKNAEGLVQLGNEVSSGFKKAQTALNELSVEVEEGFNRTGKAVNALKEKDVEQDKRLNVVEFGVGTLVEAVQGKADNSTVRALDERIQKSNEEIKLVQQAVGINALGVMNNKMAISELDRRVAKVSREMQKGLAAQSALSQLSPSSNRVGKVNMSAAVGFYNGNSALAIGTGYRVNEGFSARAGFALSGGDVSGGAGINYEW
ncbi:hypothetical protein A4A71_01855 [Nicoletella semolina]|nr:YadA C-terminal domain-containing protein [Nicoletella semolina]MDH2924112.1 hypothetical protein [Nicoletella semolina]